ncbi:preprotein translocase subunit SecE [bacterium]|nr:preprotein translocase subunit SecE [bacterium]MCK5485875.1 preprotein translocase subunit SecE [Desulfobacterales bacterium]
MLKRTRGFLTEVRVELKKVSWPSRADTMSSTGVVLVVVFIISFYLGFIDILLSRMVTSLFG